MKSVRPPLFTKLFHKKSFFSQLMASLSNVDNDSDDNDKNDDN